MVTENWNAFLVCPTPNEIPSPLKRQLFQTLKLHTGWLCPWSRFTHFISLFQILMLLSAEPLHSWLFQTVMQCTELVSFENIDTVSIFIPYSYYGITRATTQILIPNFQTHHIVRVSYCRIYLWESQYKLHKKPVNFLNCLTSMCHQMRTEEEWNGRNGCRRRRE